MLYRALATCIGATCFGETRPGACARAGLAIFTWNFDAWGKFLGTSFQGMTPAPLQ
jgi:hypothetical protein